MTSSILLFNFLGPEMIVIVLVILLLFGGKKIPELMRGIGSGIKEFKDASKGDDSPSIEKKKD
jgi:sec-independent protein translocase protein TatA